MPTSTTYVYAMVNGTKAGAWSRYEYPFQIEAWAQLGDGLYLKTLDGTILKVDEGVATDAVNPTLGEDGWSWEAEPFPGEVLTLYLDASTPGFNSMLEAVDVITTGNQGPALSVLYDQTNISFETEPYQVPPDTLPGTPIPIPVTAPSMAVRLRWEGGYSWSLQAINLYMLQNGGQP